LDTDTTWYVRVRAVNQVGAEGPWSAVANNTTGLASTHDLNVEAATAIASVKKSGGFYPSFWNPGGLGLSQAYDVARMNVTFEEAADVEVAASWQFYLNIRDLDTASVRLFMDNTLYGRSEHKQGTQDQNLTLSGTTQASIANVPAGTHQFKVQFGISDTNGDGETSSITPDEIELQVFRSKR
jgi:hypothetical protein